MSRKEEKSRADIYARITDRIVADLERGVRPWTQPWTVADTAGRITRPLRYNGQPYSGVNVILLWSEAAARGFTSPTWMTFKQAAELGGHVRKGETGSVVVYASRFTKTETDGNGDEVERDVPFLKAYTVFCVDQIDGLPEHYYGWPATVSTPIERNAHADAFFANTGAVVRHGGIMAFYAPSSDHIQMPPLESFRDAESYVAVRAHETVHWTAPSHRVNRDLSRYGKDRSERAREELIAELGSCFLCADLGIVPELEPRPDHASYLASWMEVMSNEKRFIFAAAAQRAVAYLHGLQPKGVRVRGGCMMSRQRGDPCRPATDLPTRSTIRLRVLSPAPASSPQPSLLWPRTASSIRCQTMRSAQTPAGSRPSFKITSPR